MPALLTSSERPNSETELQLHIHNLETLAARLAREGNVNGARAARANLYAVLNTADRLKVVS
jgi:hypothetical protein